jgi:hypothetical protein
MKEEINRIEHIRQKIKINDNLYKLDKSLLKTSINIELDKLDYRLKQIEVYLGIPKDERYNYLGI